MIICIDIICSIKFRIQDTFAKKVSKLPEVAHPGTRFGWKTVPMIGKALKTVFKNTLQHFQE